METWVWLALIVTVVVCAALSGASRTLGSRGGRGLGAGGGSKEWRGATRMRAGLHKHYIINATPFPAHVEVRYDDPCSHEGRDINAGSTTEIGANCTLTGISGRIQETGGVLTSAGTIGTAEVSLSSNYDSRWTGDATWVVYGPVINPNNGRRYYGVSRVVDETHECFSH
jgi:hypothetical protein